jgi:hypothetical protein
MRRVPVELMLVPAYMLLIGGVLFLTASAVYMLVFYALYEYTKSAAWLALGLIMLSLGVGSTAGGVYLIKWVEKKRRAYVL